jgi:hypothetical protein
MKNEFLNSQPHPENDGSACTVPDDSAKPLAGALALAAACIGDAGGAPGTCGGAWADGEFILLCPGAEDPQGVFIYRGTEIGSLSPGERFASFDLPVTGVSCFEDSGEGGVCICAGEVYLFSLKGRQTGRLPVIARHASALCDGEQRWLCYDGKLRRINNGLDGFESEPLEITAVPYFLSPTRRDAPHNEHRSRPGRSGGCLFFHEGRYYYFFSDLFRRSDRENLDSFCCSAENLNGRFERRYLVIPNGGIPNVFHGKDGKLYAAFTGARPESAVFGQPAILPLEFKDGEFIRPSSLYILEADTVSSLRPIKDIGEIRDPFILNAPDGYYYLTGTTRRPEGDFWTGTDGVRVWRGKDLKNFEALGKVFDYRDSPASWQNQVSRNLNCWAPEIAFYDNTFWITYSTAPGCGLLKSVSGKIEGPYKDMGRVVIKGIDSGFFLENETLYLIWQNGRAAPLSRDGCTMTEEPVLLLPEDGQEVGYEGAGLIKVGEKYVLYGAEWHGDRRIDGTYDMMYSVSGNIWGPYSKRRLLVPHGGHGCLFYDKEGRLRFTLFGNDRSAPFRRRLGIGFVKVEQKGEGLFLSV